MVERALLGGRAGEAGGRATTTVGDGGDGAREDTAPREEGNGSDAGDSEAPFRRGHALSGPAVSRLHYELLGLLRRRDVGRLQLEDALCELADAAVAASCLEDPGRGRPSVSSAAPARHGATASRP